MDSWVNNLFAHRVGLADDYGNMMLSMGMAQQQRPQDGQGLATPTSLDSPTRRRSHDRPEKSSMPQSEGVLSGRAACVTCHQRKVKCDLAKSGAPCTACAKAKRNDCVLHRRRNRVSTRLPKTAGVATTPPRSDEGRVLDGDWNRPDSRNEASTVYVDPSLESTVYWIPYASTAIENTTMGACQCALIDFLHLETSTRSLLSDKLDSVENIGTASSNAQFLIRRDTGGHNSSTAWTSQSRHSVENKTTIATAAKIMSENADAERYIEGYFTHINPSFPVLDREDLPDADPVDPSTLLLASVILLLGAHAASETRESTNARLCRRAKDLFDAQIDANSSQEVLVQAALLLSWVAGKSCTGTTPWYWINMANTVATELGMHRDVERSSADSRIKSRWRRLWWLLFRSQVQICFQLGRPQIISLEECDVQILKLEDLSVCMDRNEAEVFLQSIRLAIVQSRVLKDYFRPTVSRSERHAVRIRSESELFGWRAHVPQHLYAEGRSTYAPEVPMLWLSYLSTILLLYRPNSKEKRLNTTCTATDATVCRIAACNITALLADLRDSDRLKFLPQYIVHIAFSALIELFVETLLSTGDDDNPAQKELDSVRASMRALGEFWPQANTTLERFDASAPILATQQENISADIRELQLAEPDRGVDRDCDSQTDEMECEDEGIGERPEPLDSEQRIALLFGVEKSHKADVQSVLREWKRWRQFYWRWSHIRCG